MRQLFNARQSLLRGWRPEKRFQLVVLTPLAQLLSNLFLGRLVHPERFLPSSGGESCPAPAALEPQSARWLASIAAYQL